MSSQAEAIAGERVSDAEIQAMLAKAVRLYAERVAEGENTLAAFPDAANVTATDVMITATAMLKAVNLQVFELGMWQAWTGRQ
jgi:3-methyladenine DNA glycosylase/8-oxoguanine DNA glycosylase